jgi:putative ABC transport system substrate-binding protein
MKRRQFITLLGGAVAWPLAARAQQPARPVVGLLLAGFPSRTAHFVAAFRQGLSESGYVEGQNVAIEYRFAEGQFERLPGLATELVQRRVEVIVAGPRAERVAKSVTGIIPIVFMSGLDPVRSGLVSSINRPGGNLTGATILSFDLESKRIGLLHELVPQVGTIAVLMEPNRPEAALQVQEAQKAARNIGVTIQVVSAGSEGEVEAAIIGVRERAGALMVASSLYFVNMRVRLVELAARHKIPAMYEVRDFAEAGGLMSYSPSATEAWRQVGVYTGRILKGDKPSDLPVMQPTKFELVINLKTAKALGLTVPDKLLALADEVIE